MRFSLIALLSFISVFSVNAQLYIEGRFQGKNLFLQNPTDQNGEKLCINQVTLNGNVLDLDLAHSALELDFTSYDLAIGEEIKLVIDHKIGCVPKVLNPSDILPKSTFEISEMKVDKEGKLVWTTNGEKGPLLYQVETYRWDKWVNEGNVMGTGEEGPNQYELIIKFHSGENQVRLFQVDYSGIKRKSPEKTFETDIKPVKILISDENEQLLFISEGKSITTKYELFDASGSLLKKGFSNKIDHKSLPKGEYSINFDNTNEKLVKGDLMKVMPKKKKENE